MCFRRAPLASIADVCMRQTSPHKAIIRRRVHTAACTYHDLCFDADNSLMADAIGTATRSKDSARDIVYACTFGWEWSHF